MNDRARSVARFMVAYSAGYFTMSILAFTVMKKMEDINDKLFTAAKDNHDLAVKLAKHIDQDVLEKILDDFQFELITRDLE